MSVFSVPYRWRYRPIANLRSIARDWCITLPLNVWRYLPWLLTDAETREAAEIIARMRDNEPIIEKHGYARYATMTAEQKRAMWEAVREDEISDRKRFGELMSKMPWWWD